MSQKKLSIITICYNEPNLEETCKSVVNQTWQDFEWIVVDGGSDKLTIDTICKYKSRIDKFVSEKDNGIYDAMNKGIKLAEGGYLLFLNAGDSFFYDDVLYDIFKVHDYRSDVLYGNEYFKYEEVFQCYVKLMPQNLTKEFFYDSTLRHQAAFIKRELFDKYGLYDETYKITADYEKFLKFFVNGAVFEYLPYIVSTFNTYGASSNFKNTGSERNRIVSKYFTGEEREKCKRNAAAGKMKFTFLERIFSVKTDRIRNYRIISILGVRIKLKRNKSADNE